MRKISVGNGAGRGIGKAVSAALREADATVAELDITFEQPLHSQQLLLDVSDSHAANNTVDTIEQTLGAIDYLVNVADTLKLGALLRCCL